MASIAYSVITTDFGFQVNWTSFSNGDTCDHFMCHNIPDISVNMGGGNAAGSTQIHGANLGGEKLKSGPGSFFAMQHFGSNVAVASLLNSGYITLLTRAMFIKPVAGTANEVSVTMLLGR